MNTKSKLKAISIGIAAIIMVSLFAVMTVSASVVTDCWIGTSDNKVYFTIYSDAKAEGHMCLNVDGAYQERKKYTLNAGETTTLSFREYRWNGVDDVEVCVDCVDTSCCNPIPTPPTFTVTAWPSSTYYYIGSPVYIYYTVNKPCYARVTHLIQNSNIFWAGPRYVWAGTHTYSGTIWSPRGMRTVVVDAWTSSGEYAYAVTSYNVG